MSELEAIQKAGDAPATVDSMVAALITLGLKPGVTVIVHSSLSALGWVSGGPVAVILALEEVLGSDGTLVMPTHSSDLSDPADWQNPPVPESWWETIRQTMPAYDPDLTHTRGMGIIPETFRKQKGVLRSAHPHGSFAAWGKNAAFVTAKHTLDNIFGEDSPLARIYDLDGWVLLLGVGHNNNTSLHLAEHRADFPGKKSITNNAPVKLNGKRQWTQFEGIDLNERDFEQIGAAFNEANGAVRQGHIAQARATLCPQRPLVDFAVQWMVANRTS